MTLTLAAKRKSTGAANPSIAALARERLMSSGCRALQQVRCDYHEGTLFLSGKVSTYYLKQLAQETVREMPGVNEISNRIEVSSSDLPLAHVIHHRISGP